MTGAEPSLAEKLDRVAAYERAVRPTAVTRALVRLGPTRAFAALYHRYGPRADPWLYRHSGGRIASRLFGLPALLLTTTGARSGLPRTSPLLYARDAADFVVTGTNFGQPHHPAWTANLLAHPEAIVEVADQRFPVVARMVEEEERAELWPRLLAFYPGYDTYVVRSGRVPRTFVLRPH